MRTERLTRLIVHKCIFRIGNTKRLTWKTMDINKWLWHLQPSPVIIVPFHSVLVKFYPEACIHTHQQCPDMEMHSFNSAFVLIIRGSLVRKPMRHSNHTFVPMPTVHFHSKCLFGQFKKNQDLLQKNLYISGKVINCVN